MYRYMSTRKQSDFQEKIQKAMDAEGLDAILLTSPQNIFYATGYIDPFLYKASAAPGFSIAVVNRTGKAVLICSQFVQGGAELQTKGDVDVIGYPVWIYIEDYRDPSELCKEVQPDLNKSFRIAVQSAYTSGKGKIGVERPLVPYDKYCFLAESVGGDRLVDITTFMVGLRTIKSAWEIDVLRYAAQTAEKMFQYVMEHTETGMCEADLVKMWYQSAYEITGGREVVYAYDVHTPASEFWATGLPRERPFESGDVIRLDGGINIYGYMSDLARTYAVGKAVPAERQAIFDTLLAARDAGVEKMVPGARLCDVFQTVMQVCREGALPQYVRGHCGHSISLGPGEEFPMLSPDNTSVLEPGMVMCFETPYYSSRYHCYNLEDMILITESGHELFTNTNRGLIL